MGHNTFATPLSDRERQVLQLVADGKRNEDIATELDIRLETAKSHLRHIQGKLCSRSRAHAVAIGLRRGLIR